MEEINMRNENYNPLVQLEVEELIYIRDKTSVGSTLWQEASSMLAAKQQTNAMYGK